MAGDHTLQVILFRFHPSVVGRFESPELMAAHYAPRAQHENLMIAIPDARNRELVVRRETR
jgi:hypothetical protein